MDHATKAAELFLAECNCAQAVVVAFSDLTGLDEKTAYRLAAPFGGGLARQREVCGGVSGMLMVLGLLYGYETPGEKDCNKRACYTETQALCARFRQEVGSILCREILKNPPSDPNPTPRTAEFYKTRPCTRMVMTAARLLDEYIAEHPVEA